LTQTFVNVYQLMRNAHTWIVTTHSKQLILNHVNATAIMVAHKTIPKIVTLAHAIMSVTLNVPCGILGTLRLALASRLATKTAVNGMNMKKKPVLATRFAL